MKRIGVAAVVCLLSGWLVLGLEAQRPRPVPGEEKPVPATPGSPGEPGELSVPLGAVPLLLQFSGQMRNALGHPLTGVVGVTFALYEEPEGGLPLWQETQNVQLDEEGRYRVLLGSETKDGFPVKVLATGEARWLGIQMQGQAKGPRILLVSVPYALKAEEAERLAGKTAADFVLSRNLEKEVRQQVEVVVREEVQGKGGEGFILNLTEGPSTFSGTNTTQIVLVQQDGTGFALRGNSEQGTGIFGVARDPAAVVWGVRGETLSTGVGAAGVLGIGPNLGLRGQATSASGRGLQGQGLAMGVRGFASGTSGLGSWNTASSATGSTVGMRGETMSADGIGIESWAPAGAKLFSGKAGGTTERFRVFGDGRTTSGPGFTSAAVNDLNILNLIVGINTDGRNNGISFWENSSGFSMGIGYDGSGSGTTNEINIYSDSSFGTSLPTKLVRFTNGGNVTISGNLSVVGSLTKGSGTFKIDHPLDPENKYLSHSFVESPEMKNVYDGVVKLDGAGQAWIELPGWFEALNSDFRYQLTAIGASMPGLFVAQEISKNRFLIDGGQPGGKVSWQVTGNRRDPYARVHPIAVEEAKPENLRGYYLHPEAYGLPTERGIGYARTLPGPAEGGGDPDGVAQEAAKPAPVQAPGLAPRKRDPQTKQDTKRP